LPSAPEKRRERVTQLVRGDALRQRRDGGIDAVGQRGTISARWQDQGFSAGCSRNTVTADYRSAKTQGLYLELRRARSSSSRGLLSCCVDEQPIQNRLKGGAKWSMLM
jgi:hypothetical protein